VIGPWPLEPNHYQEISMNPQNDNEERKGNIRWGLAAMLLGLPLPFIILAFLFGGCGGGGY
jgi:hypothetical protein